MDVAAILDPSLNSILENSNWDNISEDIIKKIHIWNRVRLSLRGKKIIVNQILLSKLRYIGQMYTILINKEIERIYNFLWNGKNTTSQTPSSTLHLEGWTRYFRHRHSIKLSKFHKCSLERSHAVSVKLNWTTFHH